MAMEVAGACCDGGRGERSAREDGKDEEGGQDGIGTDRKRSSEKQVPRQGAGAPTDAPARRTNTVVSDPQDEEWRLLDDSEATSMLSETEFRAMRMEEERAVRTPMEPARRPQAGPFDADRFWMEHVHVDVPNTFARSHDKEEGDGRVRRSSVTKASSCMRRGCKRTWDERKYKTDNDAHMTHSKVPFYLHTCISGHPR